MRSRIGLFGGTFNPIHFGHINLAIEMKEKKDLHEVWFIPSLQTPLRDPSEVIEASHRLKMVELAIADIADFKVCPIELERSPPSYTIDTVQEILSLYPEKDFFLILAEDVLIRFKEWKDADEIVKQIPLLIGSRPHSSLIDRLPHLGLSQVVLDSICRGMVITRELDVSATEIRHRIKETLYCRHVVPSKVLDYIYENQLYSNSPFVKK